MDLANNFKNLLQSNDQDVPVGSGHLNTVEDVLDRPISTEEVRNALQKGKPNEAPG